MVVEKETRKIQKLLAEMYIDQGSGHIEALFYNIGTILSWSEFDALDRDRIVDAFLVGIHHKKE